MKVSHGVDHALGTVPGPATDWWGCPQVSVVEPSGDGPLAPTADRSRPSSRGRLLPTGWPLSMLFLGFPLWWLLGLGEFVFFLAAIPMGVHLMRLPRVRAPRGFGLWLAFLAVVLVSALVLTADAPYGTTGGLGGRLLTYGYRLAWYAASTIALLYVGNLTEREMPSRRLGRLLGYMFVVTAVGGLLGVVRPHLQFTAPLELLLPGHLANNRFLHALIHPATADIENVLGFEAPRPRAPFAYANSWGANFSFFLPFFVWTWCSRSDGWRRTLAPVILAIGAVAVIYSLNRGLWIALVVAGAYAGVQLLRLRGAKALSWLVPLMLVVLLAAVASPLSGLVTQRLAHPHSNDRRGELATKTVESALQGSPVIGFGNTRDVQGAFSSIAGGRTPDCPGCGVPPLGTQGHLWLVIFSQGLVGTAMFLGFFAVRLRRHLRSRSMPVMVGMAVLLCFLVELLVYDTLGSPLFTAMLALGLMWRAGRTSDEHVEATAGGQARQDGARPDGAVMTVRS